MSRTRFTGLAVGGVEGGVGLLEVDANGNMTTSGTLAAGATTVSSLATTGAQTQGAAAGAAGSFGRKILKTTAIVDATLTTVATVTVPNVAASAVFRILIRSTLTGANAYDSTRVVEYLLTVARTVGKAAVGVLSSAIGAQIATVASGATLTSTLAVATVVGAVGASNTLPLQITNTGSVAQVSETEIVVELLNGAAGGITVA